MRRVPVPSILALLVAIAAPVAAATPAPNVKVTPGLAAALAAAPDGAADMLIVLADQADLSAAHRLPTKLAKTRYVYEQLTKTAARAQGPVIAALESAGAPHRAFWVANAIWTHGNADLAAQLAARPDVARLEPNPTVHIAQPIVSPEPPAATPDTVEWNINWVHAPDVWALGYTGQGVVVAGEDTGYQWDHPALKSHYRGWNGSSADHNYNWHDAIHTGGGGCGANSPFPCDDYSHGTHTMGTMVGDDDTHTNQIGMAPGAKWIGCRNMDQGNGTPTTYIECIQWMIAPTDLADQNPDPSLAPDVINNSWVCPASEGCTDVTILQSAVESARAAGIFFVASAGNSGSACSSVDTPPAIYDAAFSVGATDSSDLPASFSSRGPVTADGSNRMKPDIAAPGMNIRSSVPTNAYQGGWNGTSMAGPHVAGLVALMISAHHELAGNVDQIEDFIRQNAFQPAPTGQNCGGVPDSEFPNNTFGSGRIDALASVDGVLAVYPPLPFEDGFESGDTSAWTTTAP